MEVVKSKGVSTGPLRGVVGIRLVVCLRQVITRVDEALANAFGARCWLGPKAGAAQRRIFGVKRALQGVACS